MEKSTASSTNVELEIVHAVKGRVRLRLKSDDARELLPRMAQYLRQQAGILKVKIKQNSNNLVVTFEPEVTSIEQLTKSLQSVGLLEEVTSDPAVRPRAADRLLSSNGDKGTLTKRADFKTAKEPPFVPSKRDNKGKRASLTITNAQSTEQAPNKDYMRLFTVVPPLVGIAIARSLQVSGWKSILAYILAAGVTREAIDYITGESEEETEKVEVPPTKQDLATEVVIEEISTLLTAIETDYEIVHQIPGRIRLRVPRISRDLNYAQQLKQSLQQNKIITDIRLKINSSSVVIFYDSKALAKFNKEQAAFNNRNENKGIQTVDESESSTMPDQETNNQKPAPECEQNETPPPDAENSSEPINLTSETETKTGDSDTVEIEEETTTPITHEESKTETNQELATQETITDYWSNFKPSMLWAMLEMMGELQLQTAEI